ncbi:hypothetical protein E0Z10_g10987 [Xylaria hypoxylon]|uniref:BZIP domain-containing protein n=1 Tax=Xylaria hypoxylon TaxID=37992 RepID=A0A4Z0Y863_9PEZI|nr:hypothetical protein E0Z10_g10987 [Xylaria hypoxylon]
MSIDDNMNATPAYSQFNFHNEEDLGFGMFDVPAATNHPGFHQSLQPAPYANAFPLHTQAPPSGHISSSNPAFGFFPRSLVASYDEHRRSSTPYPTYAKFESPALSSGSSSTPDTNESRQLITPPKNTSTLRQVPDDEDDMEDFDDDSPPVMSSGRKKSGKHKAKENVEPQENEGRRSHFLQRNRVAAMKCRKKKKEWVSDLEETKLGLEGQNAQLHMELDGLVDEASHIRAQLMAHANCNDSNIDKWIENEAKRFVIGTGERYDQILSHFSPTQGVGNNQQEAMPSSSGTASEYTTGRPNLISPLATPSQLAPTPHAGQVPPTPAFFTPNARPMNTPGCYPVPSQEAAQFAQGFNQPPVADEEPDYDGMPMTLYDHPIS